MTDKKKLIQMALDGKDTVLLQKNARCPFCAGILKRREMNKDIHIICVNCKSRFIPIEDFLNSDIICKVLYNGYSKTE